MPLGNLPGPACAPLRAGEAVIVLLRENDLHAALATHGGCLFHVGIGHVNSPQLMDTREEIIPTSVHQLKFEYAKNFCFALLSSSARVTLVDRENFVLLETHNSRLGYTKVEFPF